MQFRPHFADSPQPRLAKGSRKRVTNTESFTHSYTCTTPPSSYDRAIPRSNFAGPVKGPPTTGSRNLAPTCPSKVRWYLDKR